MMKYTSGEYNFVIPAQRVLLGLESLTTTAYPLRVQAGIQQDKNAFCLNPLDSRLRGNDGCIEGLCNG